MSREQDASKAKENLNNLDTKALGREVISSCASGYLRGVVVAILVRTINANSNEFENGCHLKQAKDTKTGVASTADSVSMFMKKYWSRRSSRENNAGLACGHEQVKRVESADAAQRRGTVECPRLACTQCAQMDETENVLQHEYSTGHRPRLARQVALNAATEHGETTCEAGVDRPPLLFESAKSTRHSTPRRSAEIHLFGTNEFFLVASRDVLSYALVTPESFPVESTRVLFLVSSA